MENLWKNGLLDSHQIKKLYYEWLLRILIVQFGVLFLNQGQQQLNIFQLIKHQNFGNLFFTKLCMDNCSLQNLYMYKIIITCSIPFQAQVQFYNPWNTTSVLVKCSTVCKTTIQRNRPIYIHTACILLTAYDLHRLSE